MLLQTNSYVVPKDRRSEHTRLLRKFRQTLARLGCESFEVYEQVGPNWAPGEATGRFVQIMRFRDRAQQLEVQEGEKRDPIAQQLIQEFCALINFPYQQQQGLFAVGFYTSALPVAPPRPAQAGRPPVQTAPMASATEPEAPAAQPEAAAEGEPQANETQDQGASLLDIAEMTPAEEASTALHLTSDTPDAAESNGEHATPFTDATIEEEPLTDDREVILGELTGENVPHDDEQSRSHAR